MHGLTIISNEENRSALNAKYTPQMQWSSDMCKMMCEKDTDYTCKLPEFVQQSRAMIIDTQLP